MSVECAECGAIDFDTNYANDCSEKRRMDADGLCFFCAFWRNRVDTVGLKTVILNGEYLEIGEVLSDDYRGFVGFGGAEWSIAFHDGRKATTKNMWSRGMVPEHFRERLPDNAVREVPQ